MGTEHTLGEAVVVDPDTRSNEEIPSWSADAIRDVFDAVPDAMLAVDHLGLIVMANG